MGINDNRRPFRDLHTRPAPRPLWQLIPQQVPYGIQIDPTNLCNFRCPFCPTGNGALLAHVGRPKGTMDFRLYQKIVADLHELTQQCGQKIRRLQLWKDGEPLLHKQLPDMIRSAKYAQVAESIETTTNGALLTRDKSAQLINAGLDVLRISVEHVQDAFYEKVSNGKIKYEDIRENVRVCFGTKLASASTMHLHVKIVDAGLLDAEKEKFARDFAPICDSWNVERIMGWSRNDLQDFTMGVSSTTGPDGMVRKMNRIVCPEPFAKLMFNFDGTVSVCCVDWSHGTIVGDVKRDTVHEIWTGERLREFRLLHLSGKRNKITPCSSCDYIECFPSFADLDEHREILLDIFRICGSHNDYTN